MGQGIGYPMFTLERSPDSAEILRNVGLDPYGYRGAHKQSIEMALQYYACHARGAGFYKIVAENSRTCPNAPQYYGKLVSGVDRMAMRSCLANGGMSGCVQCPVLQTVALVICRFRCRAAIGPADDKLRDIRGKPLHERQRRPWIARPKMVAPP
jgi:hypothetical protein